MSLFTNVCTLKFNLIGVRGVHLEIEPNDLKDQQTQKCKKQVGSEKLSPYSLHLLGEHPLLVLGTVYLLEYRNIQKLRVFFCIKLLVEWITFF